MNDGAAKKIKFLRQYGPIARNDNMYDEAIQRAARRSGIPSIVFDHPRHDDIIACFNPNTGRPTSVILTGDAGDGKTHLCRQVWEYLGGDPAAWASNDPYVSLQFTGGNAAGAALHVIRDMSAWVPQRNAAWELWKEELLHRFCRALYEPDGEDIFLIAVNDGQLVETWQRLPDAPYVAACRALFERLLVNDRQREDSVYLNFFNLSRGSSADLFDRALHAFLSYDGWGQCLEEYHADDEAFGPRCPIRRNYELLQTPLVQNRLRALFTLCDYNDLHIPIRSILLLLANAVLGHPEVKDRLMVPADVPGVIQRGTVAKASLYNNIFGGNLEPTRQASLDVFRYLDRFRIGQETSNRIDNILIFGQADDNVRPYFEEFLASDTFYGADDGYRAAQRAYVEVGDEDDTKRKALLDELVKQRRALFFKIPTAREDELGLWNLTVFTRAGEYLSDIINALADGRKVKQSIRARLVKGLNRIFVGMLLSSDRDLFLATSLSFSNARVSRLLEDSISVEPKRGERIDIVQGEGDRVPMLRVTLGRDNSCSLKLSLIRYEFLCRVANGALPSSFSRECYEDMLAFKSRILTALEQRRREEGEDDTATLSFRPLTLDSQGNPLYDVVEVTERVDA